MKKIVGIAVVLLLVSSVMAMADVNKWVIDLAASATGFPSDKTNMVGVSTEYTEGVDSTFAFSSKQFGQEGVAPPGSQAALTQLRVNASMHSPAANGYSDMRTPLNPGTIVGGTATKSWTFTIGAVNQGSAVDPGVPFTLTVAAIGQDKAGAQVSGATLPYEIAGVGYKTEYSYMFTGGVTGTFDVLHQLDVGHSWTVSGNTFGLTVTATNVSTVVTPEPGSLLALGSGLVGMIGFGIRRRKQS